MKVLYHHRTQGRGAEGVHIREMVDALRQLRCEVEMVCPPGADPYQVAENDARGSSRVTLKRRIVANVPQFVFELMEIGYNLWAHLRLRSRIRPDVGFLYERYSFFCLAGVSLAKSRKIPALIEVNEISGIKRQRPQTMVGLCGWFESRVFRKADALIVVSQFLKDRLVERGVPDAKIHVLPNAVNPQHFDHSIDPVDIVTRHNLRGRTIIGFVGMFSHWDRLDLLLEVFRRVHREESDTHLLVIGEGVQRPALQDRAKRLGIESAVTFTGEVKRSEIPSYIAACDICSLSGSNPFGSPMTLFEFMIMAKPVVVPRYGPIERIVNNGENGYLFDPEDEEEYASQLVRLVRNKERRIALGERARQTILEHHLWRHNAKKVLEIRGTVTES